MYYLMLQLAELRSSKVSYTRQYSGLWNELDLLGAYAYISIFSKIRDSVCSLFLTAFVLKQNAVITGRLLFFFFKIRPGFVIVIYVFLCGCVKMRINILIKIFKMMKFKIKIIFYEIK